MLTKYRGAVKIVTFKFEVDYFLWIIPFFFLFFSFIPRLTKLVIHYWADQKIYAHVKEGNLAFEGIPCQLSERLYM